MRKYELNKSIALFMGGYIIYSEEFELPHGSGGFIKINNWSLPKNVPLNDLESARIGNFGYDRSWDWLMPVINKINSLEKGIQFAMFKTYMSCTAEKGGKVYKDFSFSHSEYITSEQTALEAAYKLVVKFVQWYEKNKPQEP